MRFWDTSALLPLLVQQNDSRAVAALARTDTSLAVWWGTLLECTSALARLHREGDLDLEGLANARRQLGALSAAWSEILPSDALRSAAGRLLFAHFLRAADALQLAAALEWCGGKPTASELVCLDQRLRLAAAAEGFTLLPR